ncbi:MAG: Veg family protein [Bacilli bacterium]
MKEIKDYIANNIGNKFLITVDGDKKSRKTMKCVVKEVYSSLFVVDVLDEELNIPKTFTYSEVHCKEIEMVKI